MSGAGERWALTLYIAGDGDLGASATRDVEALRSAALGAGTAVCWLHDGPTEAVFEAWKDAERIRGRVGPAVNTGDPAVLRDLLVEAEFELGPGRRALVIWGHGMGWVGEAPTAPAPERARVFGPRGAVAAMGPEGLLAFDAGHGDWLDTRELVAVLGAADGPGRMALLGFDACFMAGIELLSALGAHAEVIVASADAVPGLGWDYPALVAALTDAPSPAEAAAGVVRGFAARHASSPRPVSLVAVTADGLRRGMDALQALGAAALEGGLGPAFARAVRGGPLAPYGGQSFYGYDVVDVAGLFGALPGAGPAVQAAAQALVETARAARVAAWVSDAGERERVGLSVYLGDLERNCLPAQYADLVPRASPWFRFLESAWGAARGAQA